MDRSLARMIPDSAVPADAMSEEQTFRSERSLSLRLIRLRRKWVSAEPAFNSFKKFKTFKTF
jgi:hypothetical protein